MPPSSLLRLVALPLAAALARNSLARTPPMGWMSWEIFRCNLNTPTDDCTDKATTGCISEALYQGITDGLVSSGLAAAGYASVHMDDCGSRLRAHARAHALAHAYARTRTRARARARAHAHAHKYAKQQQPLTVKPRRSLHYPNPTQAGRRRRPSATRRPTSCAATRSAFPRA